MKKNVKIIVSALCLIISTIIAMSACASSAPVKSIEYTELGIPLAAQYTDGVRARCPWDMILFKNRLYVGGGDYDSNAGPVNVCYYDLNTSQWVCEGTVDDEEINRFCLINGSLVIPGTDPRGNGIYGQFYTLEQDQWKTTQSIRGGLHNFDMVAYNGMVFAGLGVASGESPIVCSLDGGQTFSPVDMVKDGIPVDTSESALVRVYDLFILNDSLYAAFRYGETEITYDLYKFQNGVFVFDNQWYQKIHQIRYTSNIIGGKAEFKGQLFFTTGYLYATSDMANFTRVVLPNNETVYDLYAENDCLYALCGAPQENGGFEISIWANHTGEPTRFTELFRFAYDIPPISMVYRDGDIYIGMGDFQTSHDKNGMILHIQYKKE